MASAVTATSGDRKAQSSNSLTAALSRSLASSASFYFSRPIRLFRPTKISSISAMQALARERGLSLSPSAMRTILKEEGWRFIPKHLLPPFVANTLVGFSLFFTYTAAEAVLSLGLHPFPDAMVPFVAGACAGTAQAVISSPLDNVRMLLARRGAEGAASAPKFGWSGIAKEALFPVFIVGQPNGEQHSRFGQLRSLRRWATRGWSLYALSLVRDSLGFGAFFFLFETGRTYAKRAGVAVDRALNAKGWPAWLIGSTDEERKRRGWIGRTAQASCLILFGSLAGASYGVIGRPFDVARKEIWSGRMAWADKHNLAHIGTAPPTPAANPTPSPSPPRSRLARLFGSSFLKRRPATPQATLPELPSARGILRDALRREGIAHFFRRSDRAGRLDSHPALGGSSVYSGTASTPAKASPSAMGRLGKVFSVVPPYSIGLLVYAVASGDLSI